MSTKFKIDDVVKVLRRGSAGKHMEGAEGRVVKVADGWVYVEDRTGGGLFSYGGTKSWMFTEENVELVEEELADWEKELLGISEPRKLQVGDRVRVVKGTYCHTDKQVGKQGEVVDITGTGVLGVAIDGDLTLIHHPEGLDYIPEVPKEKTVQEQQVIEAGDTVRVIDEVGGHGLEVGTTHTVKAVEDPEDGKFAMIVLDVPGTRTASYAKRFELVSKAEAPKPKVKSQEIEKHEIQKGDLIVAFWQVGGVELRRKGVAHENDGDDDWMTSDGGYLTYDDELDSASHIYLLERPEVKEPTGFDALDKSVKYFLKSEGGYSDYVLAFEGGRWTYGWVGDDIRVGAAQFEVEFTEGNSGWEKPVPYEPTDLEKHTEAGTIGNRYRSGRVKYKVTKKGKVKGIITNDPLDTWVTVHWSYETFKDYVDRGTIYKI